jgi:uncharacterized protein
MKIRYINGNRLFHAVLAGGNAVIEDRDYLNKINVFPVPDADTGTNLASTMRAIAEKAKAYPSVQPTMESIADAAIAGARGNSGLIFAQFLYGLSREMRDDIQLTTRAFGESVRKAARHAYKAMLKPVEGTMLTVIKEWADDVHAHCLHISDFSELLPRSLKAAEASLKRTPEKLAVLARAGVVDAGARGFFDFIQGVADFIGRGNLRALARFRKAIPDVDAAVPVHSSAEGLEQRWCAEALIAGENLDPDIIRDVAASFGESVIVAGSGTRVRIHCHTDRPAEMFYKIKDFGTVIDIKADDMLRQYEAAHQRLGDIALVTDSSCDLPQGVLDDHQVHVIPYHVVFGESLFLDKVTLTPEKFYEMLETSPVMPKSSQPTPKAVQDMLSFLTTHYASVVVWTISEKLSGLNAMFQTAAGEYPPGKVSVFNSRQLSASLGLIVLRTAEALRGGASAAEIEAAAPEWVEKTRIWVDVRTLEYMVRGGRVSPLKGLLAKVLNIKPIVTLDAEGKAAAAGKSFSRSGNMKKIVSLIGREADRGKVWKYGLVHARSRDRAEEYASRLKGRLGLEPAYIVDISPVIGVHNGIGAVGIAMMME